MCGRDSDGYCSTLPTSELCRCWRASGELIPISRCVNKGPKARTGRGAALALSCGPKRRAVILSITWSRVTVHGDCPNLRGAGREHGTVPLRPQGDRHEWHCHGTRKPQLVGLMAMLARQHLVSGCAHDSAIRDRHVFRPETARKMSQSPARERLRST